jgi:IS1 transposase
VHAISYQAFKWLVGFLVQCFEALPDHLNVQPISRTQDVVIRRLDVEADEMQSFVKKKENKQFAQHRTISKLARKTNRIERFNNTLRQRMSRLVREALSFSKKLANHVGAIKLFICHYNLTRAEA